MTDTKKQPFTTVMLTHEISKKTVQNLLTGLFENGCSPWLHRIVRREFAPGLSKVDFEVGGKMTDPADYYTLSQIVAVTEGCSVIVRVDNPEKEEGTTMEARLNPETIRVGIQKMCEKRPQLIREILDENDDANHADVFGQFVVYGDEIFG